MKRLLQLALVCAAVLSCPRESIAASNIGFVTFCVASATSCTYNVALTGANFGNVQVCAAYRSNSTTPPTIPAGWTTVEAATGANANSIALVWKRSIGNETTSGTFTNATQVFCGVYSGADVRATTGAVGGTPNTNGGSGTTITYNAPTLADTSGASWVIGVGGAVSATNVDAAPAGSCGTPTLRTGTTVTNVALWDTAGGVTSCTAPTKAISPTGGWEAATVELFGAPTVNPITGNVVQYASYPIVSNGSTNVNNAFVVRIPNKGLTANAFLLTFHEQWTTSAPTVSSIVCDSGGGTWTNVNGSSPLVHNTTDNVDSWIYAITNATAGCSQATVTFSALVNNFHAKVQEFNQMATSSLVDGTPVGATVTAPFACPGTITTTQSGDLIYVDGIYTSNGFTNNFSGPVFHAGGGPTFLGVDRIDTFASEAFIQPASGAVSPCIQFDSTAGQNMNIVAIALKTSTGAGTARPAGIRIVGLIDYESDLATSQTIQVPFLFGNTVVTGALFQQTANTNQFTGISDSNANTYSIKSLSNGNGGFPNFAVACNTTGGDNVLVTITGMLAGSPGALFVWDIAGANATTSSSCYDSTAGLATAFGTQSGTSNITSAPNITPSTSNGLVLAIDGVGTGPTQAFASPAGAMYDCMFFTGAIDGENVCWGNGYGHFYNPNTSALSFAWQMNNSPGGTSWNASAIALIAAPSSACTMATVGAGTC